MQETQLIENNKNFSYSEFLSDLIGLNKKSYDLSKI